MIRIFDQKIKQEYHSFKKLSTGILSVLIGLSLFEPTSKGIKVKAANLKDREYQKGQYENNHSDFAIFGQIIPVDQKQKEIVGAERPYYRRDPQDPSKALATPAPKILGYHVQGATNYDQKSNMVTPPADPSQNTFLIYQKTPVVQENHENELNKQVNKQVPRKSKPDYESGQMKTKLFGFINKKKTEADSELAQSGQDKQEISNQTQASQAAGVNTEVQQAQNSYASSDTGPIKDKADRSKSKKKKSARPKPKKQESEKAALTKKSQKKQHHKKKPENKNQSATIPPVVMNKETKLPPKPFEAKLKIVDADRDEQLLTELTATGYQNDPVVFENLKEVVEIHGYDGYLFKQLINESTHQTVKASDLENLDLGKFGNEDLLFKLLMVHKIGKLTVQNNQNRVNNDELTSNSHLIVNFEGAGELTPPAVIETAVWFRTRTIDEVTGKIVPGKYDTDWQTDSKVFPTVKAPQLKSYTADPAEIAQVKAKRKDQIRTIVYQAIKKEPPKTVIDHVTLSVEFEGAGENTPENITQTVAIANGVPERKNFDEVIVPVVAGFHAEIGYLPAIKVGSKNLVKKIKYKQNANFIIVDQTGEEIAPNQAFVTDSSDASKLAPIQRLPTIEGYEAPAEKMEAYNPDKNQKVFYHKIEPAQTTQPKLKKVVPKKTTAPKEEFEQESPKPKVQRQVEFVQVVHFVDESGKKLHEDQKNNLIFKKDENGSWDKKVASFALISLPVINGYYTDQKQLLGKSVMPDDKQKTIERSVAYHQLGKVIPIDKNGDVVDSEKKWRFVNDPNDASQALADQDTPDISGWKTNIKTISPANPGIDIPVFYTEA